MVDPAMIAARGNSNTDLAREFATGTVEPSAEVKAILGDYCRRQRELLGSDWKAIKAAELTREMAPGLNKLFDLLKKD